MSQKSWKVLHNPLGTEITEYNYILEVGSQQCNGNWDFFHIHKFTDPGYYLGHFYYEKIGKVMCKMVFYTPQYMC